MKWLTKIIQKKEFQQAEQELKILKDDIEAAYNFLGKNREGYFGGKKEVPLYLLLGPARFGKTTILAQAGLNLKNFNNQPLRKITPTKYCSFWFSKEAIYVDTAGTYTKPEIAKPRNDLIWQGFIKLLQNYFGKDAIAGILIILDLPAISQDENLLRKTLFYIRERTYELAASIKNLPLHIIFTKCDLILGFNEFFSMLDIKERAKPFGVAFVDKKEKIDPMPIFENKFNELLKHLNARVIERLQKSAAADERMLIKAFPTQIGSLNHLLLEVLSKIPSGQQILLSGIYFTSSIQEGTPIDLIKDSLLHALNLKEKPTHKLEPSNNHSYFIEEIFKKIITAPGQYRQFFLPKLKVQINYIYAILIVGLIIGTSCIIGYQSYKKNTLTINAVEYLLQNQSSTTANLDNLHNIIHKLDQISQSWWLKLGIDETKLLLNELYKRYQISFIQNAALQLENDINILINSQESTTNPKKLYDVLQIYLMLSNPEKLNQTYVKTWFSNYWTNNKNYSLQKDKLQQQLEMTLQHPFKLELNKRLVAAARNKLGGLPAITLIYLFLENSYTNLPIYTKEYFKIIYNKKIPELINNLPKQDWVLGNLILQIEPSDVNKIISALREFYIKKYIAYWELVISDTEIVKINTKNLAETAKDLNLLAYSNSPLLKILQQIKNNININNAPLTFTKEINTRLEGLDTIDLIDLQRHLEKLANHFTNIAKNQNINNAAFQTIINHLQNEKPDPIIALITHSSYQLPQLQNLLKPIIKNSCTALIDAACNHINTAWQTIIIPQYQKMLNEKYPIFKSSVEDITLEDFNNFFAPQGIMDNFLNKYIKPLVNTNKTTWTWKTIYAQKINFSKESLEVFLRATLIQKMFYQDKTHNPKVQFVLTPLVIAQNTQSFTINIEGKTITFTNSGEKQKSYLAWPGPNPGLVTVDFVNQNGKYFNTSQFGPWALFKLIDKSIIVPIDINDTKHFEITFSLNGNYVKYELATMAAINPFIPEIISNFRCPEQLD